MLEIVAAESSELPRSCIKVGVAPANRSRGWAGVGAGVGAEGIVGEGSSRLSKSADSSGAGVGCPLTAAPDGSAVRATHESNKDIFLRMDGVLVKGACLL